MTQNIKMWKEDTSISAKIRRGLHAVRVWAREEGPYALVVMLIICGMGCQFFHSLNAKLSGPAATRVISTSNLPLFFSSVVPGHDPVASASRADHGLFVFEVGE